MNREFYAELAAAKKNAHCVLITAISGSRDGSDLTARKAIVDSVSGAVAACDAELREFWEDVCKNNKVNSPPFPRIAEIGGVRMLFERIFTREELIICGGGHISAPLAELGAMLDFSVTVIDDRAEFANSARFPSVREENILCAPFAATLSSLEQRENAYFVIVTRGHQFDRACLEAVLARPFAYAGMIGSRRKVAIVMEQLEADGYSRELLAQVHAPIGLRIGAQTPAEIAVCIAAELISIRSGSSGESGSGSALDPEGLSEYLRGERMMLATIVEKSGSAPRGVGAKMLVSDAGRVYGTIGGGAAEGQAAAMVSAVLESKKPLIKRFDMTSADAANDGMVCGGTLTVLLEPMV